MQIFIVLFHPKIFLIYSYINEQFLRKHCFDRINKSENKIYYIIYVHIIQETI